MEQMAIDEVALFQTYARPILMVLRKRLRVPDDAEDLLQETFQLGFQKMKAGELRDPKAAGAFLNGIARNLALNENRSRQKWVQREDHEFQSVGTLEPSPLERVMSKEQSQLIRQFLKELKPDRDRQILFAYYIEERDKTEICQELNLDFTHFNRVIFRAKNRFRALVEKKMEAQEVG